MINRSIILSVVFAVMVAIDAISAPFVVEKSAGTGKEPVSLKGLKCSGASGALFLKTLENDLVSSGYFEVDNSDYSSLSLRGTASGNGEALATQIEVSWSKTSFYWTENTLNSRSARWQAHRLADEMVRQIKGKPGKAASRIAFVSKESGGGMIAMCDSDGYGMQKFSHEKISPLSPYFSPDSRYIYYTSFIRNYPCVFRVSTTGGHREPLANFTGLNAGGAVSPDGTLIAVILSNPGNPELFCINLGTRKATRLTRTPRAAEASPAWSPCGEYIAYVSDETRTPQIYIMDSATKNSKRISFQGSQNVAPSWGADGRIAYASKQGNFKIVVYDPKTGETKTISHGNEDFEDPSWAPDGRHIICSKREGRSSSLWVLDTEGDPPVKLPLPAGEWRAPEWSKQINGNF